MSSTQAKAINFKSTKSLLLAGSCLCMLGLPQVAMAQAVDDEVLVTGTRQIIQSSMDIKRNSTEIVDGLSAAEIGDLPALSIGEALETITGASSHRENGGATEISIRGLGPFLSSTVFNGREATNGSGDRSVNFSQFPSELMNKLAIYKTQDASLIEGGVAGQISLETLKPLEYGKRRFQLDVKGNVNPDQLDIKDSERGDIGYRLTGSYVDQFDAGDGGSLGVSIGGQISAISQPEQEIRSTSPTGSSRWACLVNGVGDNANQGFTEAASKDDDCEDDNDNGGSNDGYDTSIDPVTGLAVDNGQEYTFAMSQRGYRQNDTSDERNSMFGALQWQPNASVDINLDVQWSERTQSEDRYDITFDNSRRNTRSLDIGGYTSTVDSLLTDGEGETLRIAYETEIASGGEIYERKETYTGVGLDVDYQINDRLGASVDVAYSKTNRKELQQIVRVQSGGKLETLYSIASGIPQYVIEDFDVTDINNYDDDIRLRVDNDLDRDNTLTAGRLDFEYEMGGNSIDSLEFGGLYSELGYKNLGGQRDTYTLSDGDDSIYDCETPFAEKGFLSSVREGALFSFVDGSGAVTGSSNSWATFDNACLANVILDGNEASLTYPDLIEESSATTDVTEKTWAAYLMANYEAVLGEMPIRGNVGVRYVNTDVDSIGYRNGYTVETAADGSLSLASTGELEKVNGGGGYSEFLPSFNAVIDFSDNVVLRGGIFRGLSRADPADMNFSRSFNVNEDDDITDVNDLINGVNASGNPDFDPLTSWNYDIAAEWYPNEDTMLAVGFYYKNFTGGFENVRTTETYNIDGRDITVPVTLLSTNEDTSSLQGIEVTAAHRLSYLPSLLSGLGFKVSYNWADSDFEFEDSNYGDLGYRDENGDFVQTAIGLIAPAGVPGLSENVMSAQLYWQWDKIDISGYYKFRDEYFQPYTSNGTRLRYVGANEVFEARASYTINDNFKVMVEGLNLFNEPRKDSFYQKNNFGQEMVYGPRIFFGMRAKF